MSTVAFAATDRNRIAADPGITLVMYDPEGDAHSDLGVIGGSIPEGDDGWLDEDAADALLARMGYGKVSPWIRSDGQWAAEVEHL
jgi:hypothetical protein